MRPAPSPRTRVLALLGNPVAHSLSPTFQNAAIDAAGLDAVYVALRCDDGDLPGLLRGIARAGGAGNVTIPHKEAAARSVDVATEAVRLTGACNTFWSEDGVVHGDNTDVIGFDRAVEQVLGGSASGTRVLLVGAGGAARAAALGLVRASAERIVILNRTPGRGEEIRRLFALQGTTITTCASVRDVAGESFDLAVNATSLGLRTDDALPLPPEGGADFRAALDLVYTPASTAWVREQKAKGVPAADGREMLLQQGAAAFERWWGIPAPLDAMRAALETRSTVVP